MSGDEGGRFQRWSRRKRASEALRAGQKPAAALRADDARDEPAATPAHGPAQPVTASPNEPNAAAATADSADKDTVDAAADPPADLPDVATLNRESDYTVFLREGVPEEIRRQALRALWRSDPVLANLDGLNDYDEDFTHVRTMSKAVRTAYRVGKGFLGGGGDEDRAAQASAPDPAAAIVDDGAPDPDGGTDTAVTASAADQGADATGSEDASDRPQPRDDETRPPPSEPDGRNGSGGSQGGSQSNRA